MDEGCWSSVQRELKYKDRCCNVLRFANKIEQLLQTFQDLGEAMGALYSSFKQRRQQQKANRNLVKRNMKHLHEYGLALDRELELANGHVQELLNRGDLESSISLNSLSNHLDSISLCSLRDVVDNGVDVMCSSNQREKKNIPADETMVLADERCETLDENIRLLDDRKEEIDQDIQANSARLKHINTKTESFRFRHFVSKNPIDSWSVMSTPF